MRQVTLILLTLALLVGGCEKKQEATTEDVKQAYRQYVLSVQNKDSLTWIELDSLQARHREQYKPNPCPPCPDTVRLWVRQHGDSTILTPYPPCPPDTVTLLVQIDSTTYYDGGTEYHWSYVDPDTVYQMPPGQWVVLDSIEYVQMTGWHTYGQYRFYYIGLQPDSAFILSKTLSGAERRGE